MLQNGCWSQKLTGRAPGRSVSFVAMPWRRCVLATIVSREDIGNLQDLGGSRVEAGSDYGLLSNHES